MENKFCTSCGARLEDDAKFCIHCGKAVEKIEIPPVKTGAWWIMGAFFGAFIILSLICLVI